MQHKIILFALRQQFFAWCDQMTIIFLIYIFANAKFYCYTSNSTLLFADIQIVLFRVLILTKIQAAHRLRVPKTNQFTAVRVRLQASNLLMPTTR